MLTAKENSNIILLNTVLGSLQSRVQLPKRVRVLQTKLIKIAFFVCILSSISFSKGIYLPIIIIIIATSLDSPHRGLPHLRNDGFITMLQQSLLSYQPS